MVEPEAKEAVPATASATPTSTKSMPTVAPDVVMAAVMSRVPATRIAHLENSATLSISVIAREFVILLRAVARPIHQRKRDLWLITQMTF
jgi:hypothetical protein